jgi:hypothetical protein
MEQVEMALKQNNLARESMMQDYNSMKNVVDTFDDKKKGMSQQVMGL